MAVSKAKKEQAARLLAIGKTEHETAAELEISRGTVQVWKRQNSFQLLIKSAQASLELAVVNKPARTAEADHLIIQSIAALQTSETDIATRLWTLFEKLEAKTLAVLEATSADDISPRNLPSLIRACTDVVQVGLTLNDRISGMGALVDGYQRIEQARQKDSQP